MARILCIDDESEILEIVKFDLEMEGYEVVTAESVNQALEIVRKSSFDYIISDVKMPFNDGKYFAETLRKEGVGTGICFLSAFSDIDHEFMKKNKIDGIIAKPYAPEKIIAHLKSKLKPTG